LAAFILPPIALPITLLAINVGGAMEAAKIWSRRNKPVASTAELIGTPSSMEMAPIAAKISRGLALRDKG
jgi:hypothetical protein